MKMKQHWLLAVVAVFACLGPSIAAQQIDAATQRVTANVSAHYEHLHQHPELGKQEVQTAAYLKAQLTRYGYTRYETVTSLPTTVITTFDTNRPGRTIALLERLVEVHGAPEFLRSDNGPEFIANAVKQWLAESAIGASYIEPGSPWENPFSESFNSRFRDELLDREIFASLREAKILIEDHRVLYNEGRGHSSLGYLTPSEFAESLDGAKAPKALARERATATAAERAA